MDNSDIIYIDDDDDDDEDKKIKEGSITNIDSGSCSIQVIASDEKEINSKVYGETLFKDVNCQNSILEKRLSCNTFNNIPSDCINKNTNSVSDRFVAVSPLEVLTSSEPPSLITFHSSYPNEINGSLVQVKCTDGSERFVIRQPNSKIATSDIVIPVGSRIQSVVSSNESSKCKTVIERPKNKKIIQSNNGILNKLLDSNIADGKFSTSSKSNVQDHLPQQNVRSTVQESLTLSSLLGNSLAINVQNTLPSTLVETPISVSVQIPNAGLDRHNKIQVPVSVRTMTRQSQMPDCLNSSNEILPTLCNYSIHESLSAQNIVSNSNICLGNTNTHSQFVIVQSLGGNSANITLQASMKNGANLAIQEPIIFGNRINDDSVVSNESLATYNSKTSAVNSEATGGVSSNDIVRTSPNNMKQLTLQQFLNRSNQLAVSSAIKSCYSSLVPSSENIKKNNDEHTTLNNLRGRQDPSIHSSDLSVSQESITPITSVESSEKECYSGFYRVSVLKSSPANSIIHPEISQCTEGVTNVEPGVNMGILLFCKTCDFKTDDEDEMTRHMKYDCERSFSCDQHPSRASCGDGLTQHIKRSHSSLESNSSVSECLETTNPSKRKRNSSVNDDIILIEDSSDSSVQSVHSLNSQNAELAAECDVHSATHQLMKTQVLQEESPRLPEVVNLLNNPTIEIMNSVNGNFDNLLIESETPIESVKENHFSKDTSFIRVEPHLNVDAECTLSSIDIKEENCCQTVFGSDALNFPNRSPRATDCNTHAKVDNDRKEIKIDSHIMDSCTTKFEMECDDSDYDANVKSEGSDADNFWIDYTDMVPVDEIDVKYADERDVKGIDIADIKIDSSKDIEDISVSDVKINKDGSDESFHNINYPGCKYSDDETLLPKVKDFIQDSIEHSAQVLNNQDDIKSPFNLECNSSDRSDQDPDENSSKEVRGDGLVDEKPFICQYCGFSVATDANLQTHIKAFHLNKKANKLFLPANVKNLPVKTCLNVSSKLGKTSALVVDTHLHKCLHCSFCTHRLTNLKRHLLLSHCMFHCSKCTFTCDNGAVLKNHEINEHKKTSCLFCGKKIFLRLSDDHLHKMHPETLMYKCNICFNEFASESKLNFHVSTEHGNHLTNESLVFSCNKCAYKSLKKEELNNHFQFNHRNSTVNQNINQTAAESKLDSYLCSECGFSTSNEARFQRHMTSKHPGKINKLSETNQDKTLDGRESESDNSSVTAADERLGERCPYLCADCGYRASNETSFQRHQSDRHNKVSSSLNCSYCSYSVDKQVDLLKHKHELHPEKFPYSCNLCSFRSSRDNGLKQHLQKAHNYNVTIKMVRCKFCDFETNDDFTLQKHCKEHHKGRCFLCDHCSFIGYRRIDLIQHSANSHPNAASPVPEESTPVPDESYHCRFCDFSASTLKTLNEHKCSAHSSKLLFSCVACNYRSKNSYDVERHKANVHRLPSQFTKFYYCSFCSFKSGDANVVTQHKYKSHWTKYRFKCGKCPFRATSEVNLNSHIRSVHRMNVGKKKNSSIKTSNELITKQFLHLYSKLVINVDNEQESDLYYYYCQKCDSKFDVLQSYEKHCLIVHGQYLTCAQCPFICDSLTKLFVHKSEVHLIGKCYTCSYCKFCCSVKRRVERHETYHKSIKCYYCSFKDHISDSINDHIKNCHPDKYPTHCNKCGYQTKNNGYMKLHAQLLHNKFKCSLCDFSGEFKHELNLHTEDVHPETLAYSCGKCKFKCQGKKRLDIHNHHSHNINKCDKCKYVGVTHDDVTRHKFEHHYDYYFLTCIFCNFQSTLLSAIYMHEITSHYKRIFRCRWCYFYCESYDLLSLHVSESHCNQKDVKSVRELSNEPKGSIISNKAMDGLNPPKKKDERRVRCALCNYSSLSRDELYRHRGNCHSSYYPISCSKCPLRCKDNFILKSHFSRMH